MENLKTKMTGTCAYPDMWDLIDRETGMPKQMMTYFRCEYDSVSKKWWNVTNSNGDNSMQNLSAELTDLMETFKRTFKDANTMTRWCNDRAERTGIANSFNAYLDAQYGYYYFQIKAQKRSFTVYLNTYDRNDIVGE